MAPTSCSAMRRATSAWSPVSPVMSGTPAAMAHLKPVDRLSSTITRSPAATRAWTMWLPIYPAPPVTRIVMGLARAGGLWRSYTRGSEYQVSRRRLPQVTNPGAAYMSQRHSVSSGTGATIVMAEILFIKTSSLGDVVHHMPAVTDARHHRPDARLTWVV